MTFKHIALLTTASFLTLGLTACGGGETKPTDSGEMKINTNMPNYESHLYLEEVEGEKALAQVGVWNDATAARMDGTLYEEVKSELLEVYNSPEKIAYASYRNGRMYNFWRDETNVRGVWRRTSRAGYLSDNTSWNNVLDFDRLARVEDKNWYYKGNTCLGPDNVKCFISLSDGGKDAVVRREFNTNTRKFVEDGFVTPESKGTIDWLDEDTVVVAVDFGEGTMTDSGYPSTARIWTRGTPLAEAKEIGRSLQTDIGYWPGIWELQDGRREIIIQTSKTFFEKDFHWLPKDTMEPVHIKLPRKIDIYGMFKDQFIVRINEDWRDYKTGDMLSFDLNDFMENGEIDTVNLMYRPNASSSVQNLGITKSKVLVSIYENVSGSAHAFNWNGKKWTSNKLDFPAGALSIGSTNSDENLAFISTESFLQPDTLWMINTANMKITKAKSLPSWFDAESMVAEQFFTTSTDGTKIPYYVVRQKGIELDGTNPTLLYGYGGFKIAINPSYSATIGKAWLERGGVYVVANIRGGGEYGPMWHQAGLKEKRQLIFDDFIAVAEELIEKKITTPEHLGIHGRSNGGLLMGVMFTQRPDLFEAVVIGVPLLDMQRYHKLLAGASWIGEYGDPEDTGVEGQYIRNLSPYHQLKAGVDYPEPYIYTSTKDDRVHPGHARKFAARLEDMGLPFYYYENLDGGHAGAANLEETAHSQSMIYSYLWVKLSGEK